jgi:Zn-dependent oligopeptidase
MKRSKNAKAKNQAYHAKVRALQRYDLDITNEDLRKIVGIIQNNRAKLVMRQSHRVSVWDLEYEGKQVRVAYDKSRSSIATFLPIDQVVIFVKPEELEETY